MDLLLEKLFADYPDIKNCRKDIEGAVTILIESYQKGGKLLICGNGGSAADSEHIVGELMKGFMKKRPISQVDRQKISDIYPEEGNYLAENLQGTLPAISLVSQTALQSAYINDIAADMVFAQQVYGYGEKNDVLLGLSTSGNSQNVVNAIKVANSLGLKTIGLTGKTGGEMNQICDCTIKVPLDSTPEIQERHLPIYHTICMILEEKFFQE